MNDNRYAAPATLVADVEDTAVGERPRNVVIGVALLWIQLVLGIPGMVYQALNPPVEITEELVRTITLVTMAVVMTGSVVLYAVLNWKCWQGRNWARIVHLVFLGLGLAAIYWALPKTFSMSTIRGVVYVVQMLLDIAAVMLLFSRPANAWFKALREARR